MSYEVVCADVLDWAAENCEIGEARLAHWLKEPLQMELAT